jgi:hypothetical protein
MSWQKKAAYAKAVQNIGGLIGSNIEKYASMQDAERRELEREERADARALERERLSEERKEQGLLKQAEIFSQAESNAPGVGEARRFEKFKSDLGDTALTDEQAKEVFKSQYDQKKVGGFEGADRYVEAYSKQREDVLNEIRRLGGNSESIRFAQQDVKTAQTAEAAAAKQAFDEKRLAETERNNRAQTDATNRRIEAVIAGQASRGGSGSSESKLTPRQQSDAKALDEDIKAARKALEDATAGQASVRKTERDAAEKAKTTAEARLAEAQRQRNEFWDSVEGKRPVTPENKPAPSKAPPKIGTVQGGYRFKGGDPSKPTSWEKV